MSRWGGLCGFDGQKDMLYNKSRSTMLPQEGHGPRLHLSFYQRREVDHMTDFEMLSIIIMIISLVVMIQNNKKDK